MEMWFPDYTDELELSLIYVQNIENHKIKTATGTDPKIDSPTDSL